MDLVTNDLPATVIKARFARLKIFIVLLFCFVFCRFLGGFVEFCENEATGWQNAFCNRDTKNEPEQDDILPKRS